MEQKIRQQRRKHFVIQLTQQFKSFGTTFKLKPGILNAALFDEIAIGCA
jgi:hypothetical protein